MSTIRRVNWPFSVHVNQFDHTLVSHQYLLLGTVTLLAVCLRFYKLDAWSFWGDEVLQILRVERLFESSITSWSVSSIMMWAALEFLGTSEWSARLVPTLVGILSIPLLYIPARRILGPSTALLSVLLLALSPWHLYWSQNARFYTALLLFYNLGLLYFYLGLEENRRSYLIVAVLFLGLAFQERKVAMLCVPVIVGYLTSLKLFGFEKPAGLRFINRLNVRLFLILALLILLFNIWPILESGIEVPQAQLAWINTNPFWLISGIAFYIRLSVLVIGTVGAIYLIRQRSRAGLFLTMAALIPILAIAGLSLFTYSATRYAFVALPGWIVLASVGVTALAKSVNESGRVLVFGIVLLLVLDPISENVLYFKYQNGNRDNWKGAMTYVKEHWLPGERVFAGHPAIASYYLGQHVSHLARLDPQQIETEGMPVWFVEDMVAADTLPGQHQWIAENTGLIQVLDVHVQARNFRMRVYLYDPDNLHSP